MDKPIIYIFAGPNGAGKTTLSEAWFGEQDVVSAFVNADEFARNLDPELSQSARDMQAGRLMLKAMSDLTAERKSFAIETTLASLSYERRIKSWQSLGYHVLLIYLVLPNIEAAIARVQKRVEGGGHNIPVAVISRRFTRSLDYLYKIYVPVVDEWYIYESIADGHKLLDEGKRK